MDNKDTFITVVGYKDNKALLANTIIVEKGSIKERQEAVRKLKVMNSTIDTVILHELKKVNFQKEVVYKV